jgi:hypothetical protein
VYRGATGSRDGTQDDVQQDPGLVEAEAHGQSRHGELLLLGQRELDGPEEPVPQLGVLSAEDFVLAEQFLAGWSTAVLGLDGGQDLLGMVVRALAAAARLLGLLSDSAVGARQARSGIGDPANERYGAHGDGSSWVRLRN